MDPSSPSPPPKEPVVHGLHSPLPHPLTRPTSDSALDTVRSTSKRKSSPNSPNGSELSMGNYTIDLAKLGEPDSSWTLGKAGERDIERVSSRDDGPEDFTLRLGEWMRGTLPWKKDSDSKHTNMDGKDEGREPNHNDNQLYKEEQEGPSQIGQEEVEPSCMLPIGTSTPAFKKDRSAAPSMARTSTEAMQEHAAQEVFDQISALHAEVERLRLENERHLSAQRSYEDTLLHQRKECRILQSQVSDLKSEAGRLQASEFKANQRALRLEQELKRDGSKVGSLRAKFEPLAQELETVKLRAEAEQQAADSTINALKADLKASRDQAEKLEADQASASSAHRLEVEALKMEVQSSRTKFEIREEILKEQLQAKEAALDELRNRKPSAAASLISTELEQNREQLVETRRILRNVEEENELLAQDNERQTETISNLQRALDEERLRISDSADAQIADLQDEIGRIQAQKTTDTISYSEHKSALDKLQDDHTAATEKLSSEHKKEMNVLRSAIIKAGEGMKKREQRLIDSHAKDIGELKHQSRALEEKLQAAIAEAKSTAAADEESSTVTELRTALSALNKRLSFTNQRTVDTSKEAEKYRVAASQAYSKIKSMKEENDEINREMDKRIEKMMEDREREWRRRIKVMFKERETMAKALMEAWGKEECGAAKEGEKQRYRYKYVGKDGKVSA
ncbi:MAG: hypothetical protein Q9219_006984 [cf. Caloplaca sp. 3 TL-2023]